MMTATYDWSRNRDMWIRVLAKQTGEGLAVWNKRVEAQRFADEGTLRAWLARKGITGYARSLLVMERFGYPDFLRATADELIDRQYADRPALRAIYDALVKASAALGPIAVQARKTYVSLLTPRRTFARIQATTPTRIDLGLRLEGFRPGGRLKPSRFHPTMPLRIELARRADLDVQALAWLKRAYELNA